MKVFITVKDKTVPVYSDEVNYKKKLTLLKSAIESKLVQGRQAIKTCLDTLISIEIIGSEAILHSINERHTLALSLY